MESRAAEVHVLLVTWSAQGHINPMLRLGKILQSKGVHVTLATTELARQRMEKYFSSSSNLSSSVGSTTSAAVDNTGNFISGIKVVFFSDGLSHDFDRKNNLDTFIESLNKNGPTILSKLIHDLYENGSPRFSCIVTNPFAPWATDVAIELKIPCALLWIQPCTIFSIYYHFKNNPNYFPTTENPHLSVKLPGLPLLHTRDLPSFVLPSDKLKSVVALFLQTIDNIPKFKWILVNSFHELEKETFETISEIVPTIFRAIGPLVPPILIANKKSDDNINMNDPAAGISMWKADEDCIDWLDQKPKSSVIYVSFGSISVLSKQQMENIGNALIATKRPFLWVAKPPDYPAPEGAGLVPERFKFETKEQGLIVSWCPQDLVLTHQSIACFITHCGWNSLLEAISVGVPIIGFPQWSDQPTNAKLVSDVLGNGLRVCADEEDGVVSSEEIVKCIEEIMALDDHKGCEVRKKANEWMRCARDAVAQGGSSDQNIQLFVDDLVCLIASYDSS